MGGMYIKHSTGANAVQNAIYMVIIICSQLIGAMLGVTLSAMALDGTKNEAMKGQITVKKDQKPITVWRTAVLAPSAGPYSTNMTGRIFAAEILATFLFVSFVLQIVKHNGSKIDLVNTIGVGLALTV